MPSTQADRNGTWRCGIIYCGHPSEREAKDHWEKYCKEVKESHLHDERPCPLGRSCWCWNLRSDDWKRRNDKALMLNGKPTLRGEAEGLLGMDC